MIYKVTTTEKIVYDVIADSEDDARTKLLTSDYDYAVVESMRIEKIEEEEWTWKIAKESQEI